MNFAGVELKLNVLQKGVFSPADLLLSALLGALSLAFLGFVFYKSLFAVLLGALGGIFAGPWWWKKQKIEKMQNEMRLEFREALYLLVVALKAGRSLEGAFEASYEDMDPYVTPLLYKEWEKIVGQIRVGFPVEEALRQLGISSGIEEVLSLTAAVEVCKRTEGDIARVLEGTIRTIQDRIEMRQEIKVMIAQKKMEQRIMSLAPFAVIVLLMILSPDYLSPLYQSLQGRFIMTVCVILSILSILIAKKIVAIEL